MKDTIRLYPAHEEEIVRCVHIDQSVSLSSLMKLKGLWTNISKTGTILTGGEDGFVRMWKANEG